MGATFTNVGSLQIVGSFLTWDYKVVRKVIGLVWITPNLLLPSSLSLKWNSLTGEGEES